MTGSICRKPQGRAGHLSLSQKAGRGFECQFVFPAKGTETIENAEVVFIGSPNWLKTFAPPVLSFLRTVDLSGKTIIPFCTHGGGGFGRMIEDYKKECKNSIIKDGIALKGDYSFDELKKWLDSNL